MAAITAGVAAVLFVVPQMGRAIVHSVPVASFGDGIVVRRVDPGPPSPAAPGGKATVRSK